MGKIRNIPKLSDKDLIRFWSKVKILGQDDCWEWQAAISGKMEYGGFRLGNHLFRSNRVALFIHTDIQGDMALHSCDNTSCCNPRHLYWGSCQDNVDDRMKRGRHVTHDVKGIKHPLAKLNELNVIQIRKSYHSDKVSAANLAKQYKVGLMTIYDIVKNHTWKHIL